MAASKRARARSRGGTSGSVAVCPSAVSQELCPVAPLGEAVAVGVDYLLASEAAVGRPVELLEERDTTDARLPAGKPLNLLCQAHGVVERHGREGALRALALRLAVRGVRALRRLLATRPAGCAPTASGWRGLLLESSRVAGRLRRIAIRDDGSVRGRLVLVCAFHGNSLPAQYAAAGRKGCSRALGTAAQDAGLLGVRRYASREALQFACQHAVDGLRLLSIAGRDRFAERRQCQRLQLRHAAGRETELTAHCSQWRRVRGKPEPH